MSAVERFYCVKYKNIRVFENLNILNSDKCDNKLWEKKICTEEKKQEEKTTVGAVEATSTCVRIYNSQKSN